ncbi:MAG: hypothetical protein V1740_02105 [Candidatus Woesearchaeota archaeon]
MRIRISYIFGLIAIIAGLASIFIIVPDTEVAVGFITISFGIMAIIWTALAVNSLSKGSTLRKHTTWFLLCLISILLFSVWHTMSKLFGWRQTINEALLYPGYVFLAIAFIIFVVTSFQTYNMGQELGFEKQAQKIKQVMQKKKAKKE